MTKLKLFSGKGWQSVQDCLSENLGIRIFLENWFWRNLELKNESSERLKRVFSAVCKFLSDKMETMFWESQAKRSKLFT